MDSVWTGLASYVLGDNVDNLNFGGTGNFIGAGNTLDNTLVGGAGNDVLAGGLGNDIMNGGLGNDMFVFGSGHDAVLGFGANPDGAHDQINVAGLGITAASFAADVAISGVAGSTVVTIGANTLTLVGVADAASITLADFILAG
ncbi:calcium-binding protein [Pseudomonas sp. BN417]|nr:calcium-binding protein [Pseudomonas sp. BN417]